jgi:hypothetical protein
VRDDQSGGSSEVPVVFAVSPDMDREMDGPTDWEEALSISRFVDCPGVVIQFPALTERGVHTQPGNATVACQGKRTL